MHAGHNNGNSGEFRPVSPTQLQTNNLGQLGASTAFQNERKGTALEWWTAWHSTHKPSRCFYTSVVALRQTCSVAMLRQPDRSVISLRIHFKFPRAQVLRLVLEKLGHPVDHDPCSQLAAYILRLLACTCNSCAYRYRYVPMQAA